LFVAAGLGLLSYSLGEASQDPGKSLDIPRYSDAPLELVDLKIGQKSVKKDIKAKSNQKDEVKFKESENWFKNVKVRLRNISGRPIRGFKVTLDFVSMSSYQGFRLPLSQVQDRKLKQQPLQPDEEIDLEVTESAFNDTMATAGRYGHDVNQLQPILSIDMVFFSSDLMWSKGKLFRPDPDNSTWRPVDNPTPSQVRWKPVSLTPIGYDMNQALARRRIVAKS
jgi:hypothetical protein